MKFTTNNRHVLSALKLCSKVVRPGSMLLDNKIVIRAVNDFIYVYGKGQRGSVIYKINAEVQGTGEAVVQLDKLLKLLSTFKEENVNVSIKGSKVVWSQKESLISTPSVKVDPSTWTKVDSIKDNVKVVSSFDLRSILVWASAIIPTLNDDDFSISIDKYEGIHLKRIGSDLTVESILGGVIFQMKLISTLTDGECDIFLDKSIIRMINSLSGNFVVETDYSSLIIKSDICLIKLGLTNIAFIDISKAINTDHLFKLRIDKGLVASLDRMSILKDKNDSVVKFEIQDSICSLSTEDSRGILSESFEVNLPEKLQFEVSLNNLHRFLKKHKDVDVYEIYLQNNTCFFNFKEDNVSIYYKLSYYNRGLMSEH